MKNLYVNSRLHPLLVGRRKRHGVTDMIFSLGEPWLLLTPERLQRLASRLGLGDGRVHRLVGLVRRHAAKPEAYCGRLGIKGVRYWRPDEYPPVLCPRCDGVHYPHPEDVGAVCSGCREQARRDERLKPGGGALRDRREDRMARRVLQAKQPGEFEGDTLSPHYKLNLHRRLDRDWDKAVNRIVMGESYKKVSREFNCSVGLLHRKVKERHWENN